MPWLGAGLSVSMTMPPVSLSWSSLHPGWLLVAVTRSPNLKRWSRSSVNCLISLIFLDTVALYPRIRSSPGAKAIETPASSVHTTVPAPNRAGMYCTTDNLLPTRCAGAETSTSCPCRKLRFSIVGAILSVLAAGGLCGSSRPDPRS
jgi:hypothetical protein